MARELNKFALSKSILEMKFMKKSKMKADQEVENREAMLSDALTKEMKDGESRFVIEPSFIPCEKLIVGRLSFQGMNPAIELLMESESANASMVERQKETDVTDQEMAEHYTLTGAMKRKFQTKRVKRAENQKDLDEESKNDEFEPKNKKKKPKFLKPID